MKRRLTLVAAAAIALSAALTANLAAAKPASWPRADPVDADIVLAQTVAPTTTTCTGGNPNDPDAYLTLTGGTWAGTIDDHGSMMHPYPVRGDLTLTGTFVVNHNTGTSIFLGTATMAMTSDDPTAEPISAKGPITLPASVDTWVTEDEPGDVLLRGVVSLPFYTGKKLNGTTLIANIELRFDAVAGTITGFLGSPPDLAPSVPDLALEYNGQTC